MWAFRLEDFESNITLKLQGGKSKFTSLAPPLWPSYILHRIKTFGVKTRPTLKNHICFMN